jgi:hypothetical protein
MEPMDGEARRANRRRVIRRSLYVAATFAAAVAAAVVVHKVRQRPAPIDSEHDSPPPSDSPWAALIKQIAADRDVKIDVLGENFAYLGFRSNSGKSRWYASIAYDPETDHFTSHSPYQYANKLRWFVDLVAEGVRAGQETESPEAVLT